MGSLIFVHGTGVRADSYVQTLDIVQREMKKRRPDVVVRPCLWGEPCGVRLRGGGKSIPTYDTARSLAGAARSLGATADEEEMLALWSALYDDPLFELRLMALAVPERRAADDGFGEPVPSSVAAAVLALRPDGAIVAALDPRALQGYWDDAYREVADSEELARNLGSAASDTTALERAVARAIVSALIASVQRDGFPLPDAAQRDALVKAIVDALGGSGRSLGAAIAAPFKSIASRFATRYAMRKRGILSDAAAPVAGDIILYQTRGDAIRTFIRDAIARATPPVTILAHSLGGIAAVDLLAAKAIPQVESLITAGSQAPLFYELDVLSSLRWQQPLPSYFPRWLNAYDLRDILSYVGAPVFANRVDDVRVDSGQPFPISHGAYWQNETFWSTIAPAVA